MRVAVPAVAGGDSGHMGAVVGAAPGLHHAPAQLRAAGSRAFAEVHVGGIDAFVDADPDAFAGIGQSAVPGLGGREGNGIQAGILEAGDPGDFADVHGRGIPRQIRTDPPNLVQPAQGAEALRIGDHVHEARLRIVEDAVHLAGQQLLRPGPGQGPVEIDRGLFRNRVLQPLAPPHARTPGEVARGDLVFGRDGSQVEEAALAPEPGPGMGGTPAEPELVEEGAPGMARETEQLHSRGFHGLPGGGGRRLRKGGPAVPRSRCEPLGGAVLVPGQDGPATVFTFDEGNLSGLPMGDSRNQQAKGQ